MTDPLTLAASHRHSVVAPAGCGKTELIARAVASSTDGCQLVLTHTHAGIDALRRRLKKVGARPEQYHLETIAGWALRYAVSFPKTSGVSNSMPRGQEWSAVYPAATELLRRRALKSVLRASYAGVYVDEYQDCDLDQHALVLRVAEELPCRVVGDPLQGIFGFRGPIVSWQNDVATAFAPLPETSEPWRWKQRNEALGGWLLEGRAQLIATGLLSLAHAPIEWRRLAPGEEQRIHAAICYDSVRWDGDCIALLQWEGECNDLAGRLNGTYGVVEPIDSKDLFNYATEFETNTGQERASSVIAFAKTCMIGLSVVDSARRALADGRRPQARKEEAKRVVDALLRVIDEPDLSPVRDALEVLRDAAGAVSRMELYSEMMRGLRRAISEGGTLSEAVWRIRDITRRTGRSPSQRSLGRTVLVKGLEFEHAIVLNADALDLNNLYVALTRGARSLTVLSKSQTLRPRPTRIA